MTRTAAEIVRSKKPSGGDSENPSAANLLTLPLELLWQIAKEILGDPKMTSREIKKLRLVCKSLDRAFAPIVLASIHVFHSKNWRGRVVRLSQHDNTRNNNEIHQLFTLLKKSDQLSHVKSLTLHSWDWLLQPYRRSSARLNVTSMCKRFAQLMMWPIFPFLGYLFLSQHIGPSNLLPRLYRGTSISAQFPNVTCVKWSLRKTRRGPTESHQSFRLHLKLLEALPSLTELDLTFEAFYDSVHQLTVTMSRLRNLRRLRVRMQLSRVQLRTVRLRWLKQAIAHNPNLTHLSIYQPKADENEQRVTLPDLFEDVPTNQPLKLQHLRISPQYCQITSTLIPHLRSLSSISIQHYPPNPDGMDETWRTLRAQRIYVQEVKSNCVTSDMLDYLSCLPNLTSLYVYTPGYWAQQHRTESARGLCSVLAQKAETLRCLRFEPYDWAYWFYEDNLAALSRCIALEQLVLHKVDCRRSMARPSIHQIVDFVSQLGPALSLVVDGDPILYTGLVERCRQDPRPSLQDLCQRIVYKR